MGRHRGWPATLALFSAVAALWSVSLPAARAAVTNVNEVGTSFQPPDIRIALNDRVVWTNRSAQSHTVTFTGGPDLHPSCDPLLRLGCQGPGATVERTFTSAGTFSYHCKIHPDSMRGTVVVAATSTSSATTSTTVAKSSSSTTTTTQKATSSTTSTSRPLATSSTVAKSSSTTTTSAATNVLLPGEPPSFGDDTGSNAASRSGDSSGSDSGTVALIVALLLAVSVGGGFVLWRLRPGRP